ncbi:MerR family transcriptional regulator [Primorskyibacter sp. 2E107]|uniref:MerR family transcriptional regulator n=1 Tax=Primorskyibacter sp. 2E107 TaxID=3403458 RepID=UPI003AF973FB
MAKSRDAFRTISEVADWLDTPAHVLRFWESKFTQVKPVKRAGGRRYYRPADMELLGGIKKLLHDDGLTIKGVQKVLREQGVRHVSSLSEKRADMVDDGADLIEDAPYIEVESEPLADTVVAFNREKPSDLFDGQASDGTPATPADQAPPSADPIPEYNAAAEAEVERALDAMEKASDAAEAEIAAEADQEAAQDAPAEQPTTASDAAPDAPSAPSEPDHSELVQPEVESAPVATSESPEPEMPDEAAVETAPTVPEQDYALEETAEPEKIQTDRPAQDEITAGPAAASQPAADSAPAPAQPTQPAPAQAAPEVDTPAPADRPAPQPTVDDPTPASPEPAALAPSSGPSEPEVGEDPVAPPNSQREATPATPVSQHPAQRPSAEQIDAPIETTVEPEITQSDAPVEAAPDGPLSLEETPVAESPDAIADDPVEAAPDPEAPTQGAQAAQEPEPRAFDAAPESGPDHATADQTASADPEPEQQSEPEADPADVTPPSEPIETEAEDVSEPIAAESDLASLLPKGVTTRPLTLPDFEEIDIPDVVPAPAQPGPLAYIDGATALPEAHKIALTALLPRLRAIAERPSQTN